MYQIAIWINKSNLEKALFGELDAVAKYRKNGFVEVKTNSENANAIYIKPKYIKKGE